MLALTIPLTGFAQSGVLSGSWNFSVNQAPWEYNKGSIELEQAGDGITGKVVFHTGREVPIQEISVDGDSVTFDVVVDGYDVKALCTLSDDELKGYVMTMEGNMDFSASKKIAE